MTKQVFIFISILFFGIYVAGAKDTSDLVYSSAVRETQEVKGDIVSYPEEVLYKNIETSLAKQGKYLNTLNEDGSIYVIGAATTARPSNMSGFINSRNVAYSTAELTAKMNLLRLAGEQITSQRGFQFLEDVVIDDDPVARKKAEELKEAQKLAEIGLDLALGAMGVPMSLIRQLDEPQRQLLYEQTYNEKVLSLVSGLLKGCAVVRIAEGESGNDDYQVAVCLKYSPEYETFAKTIQRGGIGSIPAGTGKSSRSTIIEMPESELLKRLGVWLTYDEDGRMVIYGFGQQEAREVGSRASAAMNRAYSQARLQAINNIKNFIAEDIVASEVMENEEKLKEYTDGSNAYFSRNKWEEAVKAKESTLNISTENVRQWKTKHPLSNSLVAGVVVVWTLDNARQANQLKNLFNTSDSSGNKSKNKTGQPHQPTVRGNITVTGSDDDL